MCDFGIGVCQSRTSFYCSLLSSYCLMQNESIVSFISLLVSMGLGCLENPKVILKTRTSNFLLMWNLLFFQLTRQTPRNGGGPPEERATIDHLELEATSTLPQRARRDPGDHLSIESKRRTQHRRELTERSPFVRMHHAIICDHPTFGKLR